MRATVAILVLLIISFVAAPRAIQVGDLCAITALLIFGLSGARQ